MSDQRNYLNQCSRQMIICDFCNGSGQFQEFDSQKPDSKATRCPKCGGEGRLLRVVTIQTRPVTVIDKVKFRKTITIG